MQFRELAAADAVFLLGQHDVMERPSGRLVGK